MALGSTVRKSGSLGREAARPMRERRPCGGSFFSLIPTLPVLSGLYVGSRAAGRGLIRTARQRQIVGRAASKLDCFGLNGRRSRLRVTLSCGLLGLAERWCQITPLRGLLSTGGRCCSGAFQRRALLERRRAESRRARSGLPL